MLLVTVVGLCLRLTPAALIVSAQQGLTATPDPGSGTPAPVQTATPIPPAELKGEYLPDEVLVRLFPFPISSPIVATALGAAYGATVEPKNALSRLDTWVLKVPPGDVPKTIAALEENPAVVFAEPNYVARAFFVPNDPHWPAQPYLSNIQAPQAWEITSGASDVVIAVVDTGIDSAHPDLAAKIWNNPGETGLDTNGKDKRSNGLDDDDNGYVDDWRGWNTLAGDENVQDDHGHGTHVAGVAAADTDNGQGIAGVACDAPIMPIKALDDSGFGAYAQVVEGIMYATDQGARVINLSFGSSAPSALLKAAVDYAHAHGVTVVAASGNSGDSMTNYPAAYPNVIAVGATAADDQIAPFSTLGELTAPGVNIYSTYPGDAYIPFSGTSLSAAHVSGAAALLASLLQFDTPAKIRDALFSTALDLGDPGWDPQYGFGLVQIYDALNHVPTEPAPTPVPTLTVTPGPTPTPSDGGVHILATPIAPTPAPTSMPSADDPHVNYVAATFSCAACHRGHTANGIALRHTWPEENLCFTCHTSGGSGTDVQSAFAGANTATGFFQHDVAATNGVHRVGQTEGTDFGGINRHVECADCHEPHEATRGAASAPMLQREMNYTSGIDPMWDAPGPPQPALFVWLPQAEREYQVCFKCHSSFTTLPTYLPDGWDGTQYVADGLSKLTSAEPNQAPDSRDLAQEFNPFNTSFHPVVAPGQNLSIPAGSFVPGWSQTSMIYCTDCHTNASATSAGPHGSPRLHLLDGQQDYTTVMTGILPPAQDQELCFKCHDAATYLDSTNANAGNTNFYRSSGNRNLHGTHMTRTGGNAATCYSCHDTHGSEQEHLLNFEVIPGVLTISGGDSQSAWRVNGTRRECALSCHGRSHSGASFRYP